MDASTARELLEGERQRLTEVQRVLRAERLDAEPEEESFGELSPRDQHQADVASEVFEREKDLSLLERVESDLADVDDALERLEGGDYGRCETCGRTIDDDRLAAVPATRFCVEHQSFWEAVRLDLSATPGGPMPGESGVSIQDLVELAALLNLDLLPTDDEVAEDVDLGPEESALHRTGGRRERGTPMTDDEIELAEARAAEDDDRQRQVAEQAERDERSGEDALALEEDRLTARLDGGPDARRS